MARPIWSGAITFGLVHVPVQIYSATESRDVRFHQFQRETGERIRYRRVAERSGEEVPWENIVKGYEIGEGEYVTITPEELESLAPEKSRAIRIEEFVELSAIDPIAWERTYYLGPADAAASAMPYALLHQAMERTQKVGIGRFVMRSKEYLATVRPYREILALETMYFADEIRGIDVVENAPSEVSIPERELRMAEQLVEALASEWDHSKYRDTHRERVLELVEKKARGERIVPERAPEGPRVIDLMSALKASLESTRAQGASARRIPADDLGSLTKSELLERAARANVQGRSKMSKDELVRALEKRKAS